MDPNTMQRIHATRMVIRALPVSRITKKVIDEDVIRTEMANHGVEDSEDLVEMFATREAKRRLTLRRL
jgi:hypothetical protein